MASFTDINPPQFNSYVQQLPIDSMVQVGMEKQRRYDEGIEKIHNQIESVAGIDVVRDVDKQYLQSKMGELGNKLKSVAAGDFSNYQLTNSVGGMITSVAKDKNVQNAAISTSKYRSETTKMQKDIDDGKSNPANLYNFNKKASSWLNSQNPGEVFNAAYTPAFDVFKFAKETFDTVKPDGYSFDQIYITNADGSIKTDGKGNPIYSPTMVRMEKEGRFPEKVREAISQIFSDPRVNNQLSIEGEYNYAGYDGNLLKQTINTKKQNLLQSYNDRLAELNIKKNTGGDVQDDIDAINLQIENINNQYGQYESMIGSNPDAIRGILYKDEVSSRYQTMFTDVKTKTQTLANPGWQANFDLLKEKNRVTEFEERMKFDKEKFNKEMEFKVLDMVQKRKESETKTLEDLPQTLQDFQDNDLQSYVSTFDRSYSNSFTKYNTSVNDLILATALSTPQNEEELNKLIRSGQSKEQATEQLIQNLAERSGESPEEFQTKWLQKSIEEMNTKGSSVIDQNPILKAVRNNFINSKQDFESFKQLKQEAEKRIDPKLLEYLNPDKIIKNTKPVTVNIEGQSVTVSPSDLYDAALYLKGNESSLGIFNNDLLQSEAGFAAERLKKSGKGFLVDFITNTIGKNSSDPITEITRTFRSQFGPNIGNSAELKDQLTNVYNSIDKGSSQAALQAKSDALKQLNYTVSPNLKTQLITGKAETDKKLINKISTMVGNYQTNEKNLSGDFDSESIMGVLSDKSNVKPFELKTKRDDATGEVYPTLTFFGGDGSQVASMSITPEEAMSLGVNMSTMYEDPSVQIVRSRIESSPQKRTSFGNPQEVSTYIQGDVLYEKDFFTNLEKFPMDVKANIQQVGNQYFPIVWVEGMSKTRSLPGSATLAEAVAKLKSINPQLINSILTEK